MIYGTSEYHWTFFTINDHLRNGISEWPLSQTELDSYIASKYGKYACITFDPTVTSTSLSYIPFTEEYIDSLYLTVDTMSGIAYRKIIKYDTLTCQMFIERNDPIFTFNEDNDLSETYNPVQMSIGQFISEDSYRIESILFDEDGCISGPNTSFFDAINIAYGEEGDVSQFHYYVARDETGESLNYELSKNATFQFYEIMNGEEPISVSTYDVISGNNNFTSVKRITYEEMEHITNDGKRTISVINPANISNFVQSYFSALNNG
jgi:hypothetical protein